MEAEIARVAQDGRSDRTFTKQIGGAALGAAMLLGAGLCAPPAQAGYIVDLTQVGGNVVATGIGTIDLAGLRFNGSGSGIGMVPSRGETITGASVLYGTYTGFTGPASFGSGGLIFASSGAATPSASTVAKMTFLCRRATSPAVLCRTPRPMTARPLRASARHPAPTYGHGGAGQPRTALRSTSECRNPRAFCYWHCRSASSGCSPCGPAGPRAPPDGAARPRRRARQNSSRPVEGSVADASGKAAVVVTYEDGAQFARRLRLPSKAAGAGFRLTGASSRRGAE